MLRHQVNILRRRAAGRLRLSNVDRLVFVWLYRLCPAVVDAVAIVRPETLIRWHRQGFRAFWRWKSCSRAGRPAVSAEIRELIRDRRRLRAPRHDPPHAPSLDQVKPFSLNHDFRDRL